MTKKKVTILGAGLAGLSAAWHLQRKGVSCQVFEKESEVGGLCRSKKIGGFTFDYDGHLLHFKRRYTFNLIKNLLHNHLLRRSRSAWIYSHGRMIRYPFQANLHGLPSRISKECLAGFIKAYEKNKVGTPQNFSEWIRRTLGVGIARHFMIPYNTKFWTLPPHKMTCEWLDGMVPIPSLGQVLAGARRDCRHSLGYNAHFWYPSHGGIDQVPRAFAKQVRNIYTGVKVSKIDLSSRKLRFASGGTEKFDHLISTVPLPEMPLMIEKMPYATAVAFKKLRWNSIFNLNLGLRGKDMRKQHWIYFPMRKVCFFRVGFPHNFSSSLTPPGQRSLYAEVSYSRDCPISKRHMVARIVSDMRKVGILSPSDVICAEDINDIEYGYPCYDHYYHSARGQIVDFLTQNKIIPCGRYGSWRYMSMEDAILDGQRVAESIWE